MPRSGRSTNARDHGPISRLTGFPMSALPCASFPVHDPESRAQRWSGRVLPSPVTFGPGTVRAAVGGWHLWRYRRYMHTPIDFGS